jgi:hypothetical protein
LVFSIFAIYLTSNRDLEDVVKLYASEDETEKPLSLHKQVACYYSPVFKAAFNSKFKEGVTQTYKLEDATQRAVRLLIHVSTASLLTQKVVTADAKSGCTSENSTSQKLSPIKPKHQSINFSSNFGSYIPSLQNDVIQELEKLRAFHKTTSTKCLHYVYDKTGPGSPLRRLFVHWCAFNVASDWFKKKPGHFPQEMLIDLVQLLSESSEEDWKTRMRERRDMADFEVEEK